MLTAKPPRGYTMRDLAACAEREVNMRKRVYENRVLTGRMTRGLADGELDKMQAIAELLEELAQGERLL
jgi:hypothetical protein